MTTETFEQFVAERFGGKLTNGSHTPDGAACLHEALNVYQGKEWSDDTTGTLDLRSLNDAPWSSDEARTTAMLPLGSIVLDWPKWSKERKQTWAKAVAEGVIREILPPTLRAVATLVPSEAPSLVAAALRCEIEGSESAARSAVESAEAAAWLARSAVESAAEAAAWSARSAVESAARSAAWSAADVPLQTICRIMVEANK